jgi:hypothetical protein
VKATGQGPLSYQWYSGSSGDTSHPIAGAMARSYTTTTLRNTTNFWIRVSNNAGTANSITAQIKVVEYLFYLPVIKRSTP